MSWKKVRLSELLKQIKQIVQIDNSKEYKLVTVSNKGIIKQREIVKGVEIKGEKAFEAKNGAFIYSRLSIHNGAFGIVPSELDGALLTSEMPIFEIGERILPEFLIYSLQLPTFIFQLEQLTKGVGRTRVKEVNFLNLLINLPNITEQKEIIKKLSIAENQCGVINSELTCQLTLVKKLCQQLLQDAVQGKLVEQNKKDEPASELLKKIKAEKEKLIAEKKLKREKEQSPLKADEIPFDIPESWIWCRFSEVVNIESNLVSPFDYPNSPHIAPDNIEKNTGKLFSYKTVAEDNVQSANHYFYSGQLIYSKVRPKLNKVVKVDFEGLCSADMYPLRPLVNTDFIQKCMLSGYFLIEVDRFDNRVKMPKINQNQLSQIPIPLPPLAEQNRIVQKLDELMQHCNELEASIKQSESQNKKLLQQVLREALRKEEVDA